MTENFSDLGFAVTDAPDFESLQFQEVSEQPVGKGRRAGQLATDLISGVLSGASETFPASPHKTANLLGRLLGLEGAELPDTGEQLRQILGAGQPSGIGKGLHRVGEAGGAVLGAGPITPAAQLPKIAGLAAAGGALGEAAKQAGAPAAVQFGAELLPLVAAPVVGGKLLAQRADKGIVQAAKRMGMTDKQIAPLIRGKGATKLGRSFLAKTETREKIFRRSAKGVDKALNTANRKVAKIGEVPVNLRSDLMERFEELARSTENAVGVTSRETKGVKFLRRELQKIARKDLTGTDLKNLYRAANKEFGTKTPEIIREAENTIVEIIGKASPEAATDFRTSNELFSRLKAIEAGPSRASEYLDRSEIFGLVTGIATGHPIAGIGGFAASEGLRRAFTHTIMGPRGQRLTAKILKSLADGKGAAAQAASKRLLDDTQTRLKELESQIDAVEG